MLIRIDPSTGVPIWQQIVGQVTRQVLSGRLSSGERLPTVRELAAELRVNPNTVARAYQELERAGAVETRRGLGTFACAMTGRTAVAELRRMIVERIDVLLVDAIHLRIGSEELRALIDERMRVMGESESDNEVHKEVKS